MHKMTLALLLLTGGLAAADPAVFLDCRIQREFTEPGTNQRQSEEIRPRLRWSGTQLQLGEDAPISVIPEPVQDPTVQQFINLFLNLAQQKAPELLSTMPQSDKPFEVLLELPSLQQRFRFQMQATVED